MKRNEFAILVIIVLIAAFFRFWQFTSTPPGLYPDEAMNGNNAREAITTGNWKVFYPENNGREGLFMNIQALSLMAFGGTEPWMLRFPSPVFGTLTVLGFFLLLYELAVLTNTPHRLELAGFGAFFMATSVWHIIFSRIGFRAIMAPFFIIWALFFFILAFRKFNFRYAILAGAALGLGAYSYIAFRVMPLLFAAFLQMYRKRRGFRHIAAGLAISAVLAAVPLLAYFAAHPADFMGRTSQVSVFSGGHPARDLLKNTALTLGSFNIYGDGNWRHNISGRPELFAPVGIFFLIGVVLAFRRRGFFNGFMAGWFLLALLPVVISNEGLPHALRSILLIPPALGFAASGALWAYLEIKRRMMLPENMRVAVAVFAFLLIFEAYVSYFIVWGKSQEVKGAFAANYVEIGRRINLLPLTQEKIVVVKAGGVDVRGVPMPAQTVMFITDSFLPEAQERKRIRYLTPAEFEREQPDTSKAAVFYIE